MEFQDIKKEIVGDDLAVYYAPLHYHFESNDGMNYGHSIYDSIMTERQFFHTYKLKMDKELL